MHKREPKPGAKPFEIKENAVYPFSWLRERLRGSVELETLIERLGLREQRIFRDGLFGFEILDAARRARPFSGQSRPRAAADLELLQTYIGHKPGSVLAAHYDKIDNERLAAVAALAQELCEGRGAFGEKAVKGTGNGRTAKIRRQQSALAGA